jgi:hypothetical protein
MVSQLIEQAPKHYLLSEDLKDVHRFTEKLFSTIRARGDRAIVLR